MTITPSEIRARLEATVAVDAPEKPSSLTVSVLARLYLAHAERTYNGRYGYKMRGSIRQSFDPLTMLYGELTPDALRPLHLRAVRQWWIEQGISRSTIQSREGLLRQAWRWARRVELISTDLPTLEPVRFGHAKDAPPVKPVELAVIEATIAVVGPIPGKLLNVILLTGMRPGEATDMRGCDVDTTRNPWRYRPALHKSSWIGKDRDIFIGPRARMLIQPLMRPTWLFTTKSGRKWTPNLLLSCVTKACAKHGIPHWHPNMLRHTAATMIRREAGLDAAQAVLGHSRIETTQVYSEKMMHLASDIALRYG